MPGSLRLAGLAAATLLLAGCSDAGAPSSDSARSPQAGVTAAFLAEPFAGLPARLLVSVKPTVGGATASASGDGPAPLGTATTDDSGRAWLSWTPADAGPLTIAVTLTPQDGSPQAADPVNATVSDADPASTPETPIDAVTGQFDAAGQRMWLDCRGQGGPTMVLIAGAWGWSKDWAPLLDDLREGGRVCVYDRPGLGSSPGREGSSTSSAGPDATELAALLTSAGEPGPFLVVGHSYGGLVAQSYDDQHPELTAGMALLDPVPPYFYDHSSEAYRTLEEGDPRVTIDLVASSEEAGGLAPLAGLPLVVISAGAPPADESAESFEAWQQLHQETAAASANSLHLVAEGATHQLQVTAPDLSLAALTELRDANREHRPLRADAELAQALP